mmetsp:Transcript_108773/g.307656  ORF Transcript_108773/g.307656 Transcript_108773/m.307656 type:complete len:267 (+) Transcript_108773:1042-1842(+)
MMAAALPLQSASSENSSAEPTSGRPSAFTSSFLALIRFVVLPTSSGRSWPTVSCSSRRAHGSGKSWSLLCCSRLPPPGPGVARSFWGVCGAAPSFSFSPASLPGESSTVSRPSTGSSSGSSRSSSCRRSSRSCTSRGGAGTSGASRSHPCVASSSTESSSSSSLASDSCSRYTPVWWTVQVLMRNSFFRRSVWSRGMRKRGTRRCKACRRSPPLCSRTVLRPSLIKWSMVKSCSVSGIGAQRPLCTAFPFFPWASFPVLKLSRSSA